MTGPVIWVVRILVVFFVLISIHLLFRTNPPPEAMIIIIAIIAVGAGLWARSERMRGDYLRKEGRRRDIQSNISATSSPLNTSQVERIVERHYHKDGSHGSRAAQVILILAAICTIIAFIRSCIK
jgi:hypothetical protein